MEVSEDNLLKLLELSPDSTDILEKLARFYLNDLRYKEAFGAYNRLAELNPLNPEYYKDIGMLLYKMDMADEAEWMFRKSIEIGSEQKDVHVNLARLLSEKGDTFGAIEHYVKYLLIQPKDYILWKEFGLLLEKADLHRILIVMEEGIGNMIMMTPTIRAIKSIHPQMKIHILGKYPALEVVEKWDLVERVLTRPDGTQYAAVFYSMWSSVSREYYRDFIERCSVCQFKIDYNNPNLHEALCNLQIAKNLGFAEQMPLPFCSSEKIDINIPQNKPLIGICDTTMPLDQVVNWERKRWPHYRDLAKVLASKGYRIVLFGGKSEADNFDPDNWPKETINCLGKYTLPQTAFLMKQCKAIVANDSGPAHMAGALSIPTFALFGPTRISKNKPVGKNITVITKNLPCSPCQYSNQWQQCNDWRCMSNIHVDDVLNAMEASPNCDIRPKHRINNDFLKATFLIVGVLDVSSSTNVFMKNGFEKIGFHVDAYNYRTRANDLGSYEAMGEDFKQFLSGKKYELILFSKVNGLDPELVNYAKQFGKTCYWFMDNIDVARAVRAEEFVKRADFASTTSEEVVRWFEKYNPKTSQILEGFDPEVYYVEKLKKKHDILFVGNATPKRIQELKEIKNGFSVSVFGNDWPEEFNAKPAIYNQDLRRTIAQSRIVLNLVHSNIFSDRVVLSAASGGFVLSQYCPDLERHFVRKHHLDWFENTYEARELIQYYLSDETERERIAKNGMEYVSNRFGWDEVCNKIVKVVNSGDDSISEKQNGACNTDEREKDKCKICDGYLVGPVLHDLMRCNGCGVYRKKDIPSRDTVREQLKSFMIGACIYREKEKARLQDASYQLDLIEKYVSPGKVYDVGAAAGFFMKAAKERGWRVDGNEISRSAIDWARKHYGLEIEYGFLEELDPLKNYYDAVVLWNTLEHTFDARKTLEICRDMLRDKGLLLIQVPDKMDEGDLIKRYEALHIYEFNHDNLPHLIDQMGFEKLEMILQDGSDDQHMTLVFQKKALHNNILPFNYKKTSERVLLVSWHGLGDNVMLTPALRKYKQLYPEKYVAVAGLKRFGKTLKQLLSGLPFVDEVIPCLPDAWNDFDDYSSGVQAVVEEAKRIAGENEFTDSIILPTKPQAGYRLHKIFRFADEVGVKFTAADELQTELNIESEADAAAKKILNLFRNPILVLHTTAGNSSKTLPPELSKAVIDNFKKHTVLEFGRKSTDRSIELNETDMELTKAIVGNADQVVAIDSVIMHIAGAFKKPCLAIFTHTPIHQAIPLTYPVDIVTNKSPLVQEEAFVNAKKEIDNIFHGHVSIAKHDLNHYYEVQYAVEEKIHLDVRDYGVDAQKFLDIIVKELPDQKELPSYPKESTVLDLGCNTGYNTKILAKKYGSAFGIDINDELIKNARENNWMDCYRMDMHHLAFKDNFFDLIFSKDILEHAYSPDTALSECYRVIKPGGLIVGLIPMDGYQNCMIGLSSGNLSHYWKTNVADFKNRVEKTGFNLIKLQKYSHQKLVHRARPMGDEIIVFVARKPDSFEGSKELRTTSSLYSSYKKRLELPKKFYSKGAYWGAFLTLRCTAGCPYCIQRIDKEKFMAAMIKYKELSGTKWLELLNGLSRRKGQSLAVIGGEPTIHPDFVQIINGLDGYTVTVTTNLKSPFFEDLDDSLKEFQPACPVRFNTSFHPEIISAELFSSRIKQMKDRGLWIDQIAMVDHPGSEFDRYKGLFAQNGLELNAQSFLGYWNERLYPDVNDLSVKNDPREHGIFDMNVYRDGFSAQKKRLMMCKNKRFLIAPDGTVHNCHYHLYSQSNMHCGNLSEGMLNLNEEYFHCEDYGFCNPCDYPHVSFKNVTQTEPMFTTIRQRFDFNNEEKLSDLSIRYEFPQSPANCRRP